MTGRFDHMTGCHVMGEQVFTLGLATESAFLPLDSEIFISQTKVQPLRYPFNDKRCIPAGRYQDVVQLSKPQDGGTNGQAGHSALIRC